MTRDELNELSAHVRRIRGRCLQRGTLLEHWLAEHPHIDRHEARQVLLALGDSPFPPIHGPHPQDRERPFYDARFLNQWSNDEPA